MFFEKHTQTSYRSGAIIQKLENALRKCVPEISFSYITSVWMSNSSEMYNTTLVFFVLSSTVLRSQSKSIVWSNPMWRKTQLGGVPTIQRAMKLKKLPYQEFSASFWAGGTKTYLSQNGYRTIASISACTSFSDMQKPQGGRKRKTLGTQFWVLSYKTSGCVF